MKIRVPKVWHQLRTSKQSVGSEKRRELKELNGRRARSGYPKAGAATVPKGIIRLSKNGIFPTAAGKGEPKGIPRATGDARISERENLVSEGVGVSGGDQKDGLDSFR